MRAPYKKSYNGIGRPRPVEHILICEEVLGKKLPPRAKIHHVDGDGHNNKHDNLVICEDQAYHKLLHRRKEALEACGYATWLKCTYCKQYGPPESMLVYQNSDREASRSHHRRCHNAYMKVWGKKKTQSTMVNN